MTMNRVLGVALPLAGGLALAAAAAVFLTAPGRADKARKEAAAGRSFAHRGLHDKEGKRPENSLAAFEAAAVEGYGVELDARLSQDGEVVVFHDARLERLCGIDARVDEMPWERLREMRLAGTEEPIPSLRQALDAVDGRTPVLIELKTGTRNTELCEKVLCLMDERAGSFLVESFDPRIVRWFRKNAPDVLRGQLVASVKTLKDETGRLQAFLISRVLTNFYARPHFIAHMLEKKSLGVRLCEALGALRVAWTCRREGDGAGSDALIFEDYLPPQVW
jgi:glycerophosphoryl diester phosphodiesterase